MGVMDFLNPLSNKDSIFYPSLDPLGLVMKKGGKNALASLGTPTYGAPTRWDQFGNGYADPMYGGQSYAPTQTMPASFNYSPMAPALPQSATNGLGPNAGGESPYYQHQNYGGSQNQSSYGGGFDQWNPGSWGEQRRYPLTRR